MTTWIGPEDAEYDERRALFNATIDKRPRLIAACRTPEDVKEALGRAAHDLLPVAVRSGGHSVAGQSTNEDGLVIDVRPMKDIVIDAKARRARVGGGCTWGDLDAAAQEHGLATTGGRVSTTGSRRPSARRSTSGSLGSRRSTTPATCSPATRTSGRWCPPEHSDGLASTTRFAAGLRGSRCWRWGRHP